MDLAWALVIWVIVVIVVYLVCRNYGLLPFGALTVALIVGLFVLALIKPVTTESFSTLFNGSDISSSVYWLIMFLSPLIILIYALVKAFQERGPAVHHFQF